MGTKQHHHPTVIQKLSSSSFPSAYYLSLLASNSNSNTKPNSNSNANATKTPSSIPENSSARKGSEWLGYFMRGVVSRTSAAPLERVKLLIQCQGEMIRSGRISEPYKGILDCFKRIIKNEGFLSLWRGNVTALITQFPKEIMIVVFNAYFKWLFNIKKDRDGYWKWFASNVASCAAASASSAFFLYSLDYARTRLANDIIITTTNKGSQRQFNGLVDVYRKTIISDGTAGLYRGFNVACVGIIVHHALYFGLYESLKPVVLPQELQNNSIAYFALAFVTTNIACAAYYPFGTVSKRMMMTSGEAYKYKSAINASSRMLKNEGLKSFYKGFGVCYLQVIAASVALANYKRLHNSVFGKSSDGKSKVSIVLRRKGTGSAGDANPF